MVPRAPNAPPACSTGPMPEDLAERRSEGVWVGSVVEYAIGGVPCAHVARLDLRLFDRA